MYFNRLRLWMAGLIAFLIGFPLSEKTFAQVDDIVFSSIDLGLAIADSAGAS